MASASLIFKDNTSVVECDQLKNLAGTFQNSATVTMTKLVVEATGVAVVGVTVPLTMAYVAASDGKYQGTIPSTATLVVGTSYLATIKAVSGGDTAQWEERVRCKLRRG